MSTNVAAIDIDMRDLVQAKKARPSNESKETGNNFSFLVSQISSQSIHEIDHLIEGLQGCARSWTMMVTAFSSRSSNIRRLASR